MLTSTQITAVLVLAFLSGITVLIGVGLAFYFKKSVKGIVAGLGFSAGVMLAISFFELLPVSIGAAGISAVIALLFGFSVIGVLNYILPHIHFCKEKGHVGRITKVGILVAIGLLLHDFPEGFAMANSYIFAPALGILVAVSIALHNIPEEFAIAVPLVIARKMRYLWIFAVLSALAEPAGALVGLFAASMFEALTPLFMAFAAGAMIFISIHELYPLAKIYKRIGYFAFGIVLSLIVYFGLTVLIPGA